MGEIQSTPRFIRNYQTVSPNSAIWWPTSTSYSIVYWSSLLIVNNPVFWPSIFTHGLLMMSRPKPYPKFRYGYYTQLLRPGFRIVSINSNFCNDENFWILTANGDPGHQHRWLIETLQNAEERFQIFSHLRRCLVNAFFENVQRIMVKLFCSLDIFHQENWTQVSIWTPYTGEYYGE